MHHPLFIFASCIWYVTRKLLGSNKYLRDRHAKSSNLSGPNKLACPTYIVPRENKQTQDLTLQGQDWARKNSMHAILFIGPNMVEGSYARIELSMKLNTFFFSFFLVFNTNVTF